MNDVQPRQVNGSSQSYNTPIHSDYGDHGGLVDSSDQSRAMPNVDSSYLSPNRGGWLRPPLSISRSGSEADSLLDLYGRPRSGVESMDKIERLGAMEDVGYLEDEDPERSRWIHRDKLLAIESQEMQEAGIKVPRTGQTVKRSANGSTAVTSIPIACATMNPKSQISEKCMTRGLSHHHSKRRKGGLKEAQ